jgi:hypothetical protein
MATNVNAVPTGNYLVTSITASTGGSTQWSCVDDTPGSPNDSDYIFPAITVTVIDALFSFSALSVPTGATINYVRVAFRGKWVNGSSGYGAKGRVRVGGTVYDAGSIAGLTTSYANYTQDMTTNPKTSVAWTVNDVNGSGSNNLQDFGVGFSASPGDPDYVNVYCSQVYLTVNYTPAAATYVGTSGGTLYTGAAMHIAG